MQSVICGDDFIGAEMGDKSVDNAAPGKSADVNAFLGVEIEGDKVAAAGWNGGFLVSIGALVTTTGTAELGESADVDAVLGVETKENKLAVSRCIDGLYVLIGALVKTSSPLSVLSTATRSELEISVKSTVDMFWGN